MVEKVAVDDDRLRRVIEVVLDHLELGDLGPFGDVERTLMERQAVGPVQPRSNDFGFALSILLDDRVNLVENARADEDGTLVADPQRDRHVSRATPRAQPRASPADAIV